MLECVCGNGVSSSSLKLEVMDTASLSGWSVGEDFGESSDPALLGLSPAICPVRLRESGVGMESP